MHLKQLTVILPAVLLGFALGANPAFGLRCSSRIITVGDPMEKVLLECGAPDYVKEWEEERFIGHPYKYRHDADNPRKYRYYANGYMEKKTILIEVWTYNFGSTRFIRYLAFENGILKKITTGEHGY